MPAPRLSPAALAQTDALLAFVRRTGITTIAALEDWWGQRPATVRRVELFRLLTDLTDDGRLTRHDGDRVSLPGVEVPPVETRPPPSPGSTAERVLTSLRAERGTHAEVAARLAMNSNTVRGRISELAADGWLRRGDDGRWEAA